MLIKLFNKYLFIFFSVVFISGFSFSIEPYKECGNSLNKEPTEFSNFPDRIIIFEKLINTLLESVVNEECQAGKYLLRAHKNFISGRNTELMPKNEEFFRYFDLVLYNVIYFSDKIAEGKSLKALNPQIQPRLTSAFMESAEGITTRDNFICRRSFIMDFFMSNLKYGMSAAEKLRLTKYAENRISMKDIMSLRDEIKNTNVILKMIKPYVEFNSNDIVKDIFDFNKKSGAVAEKNILPAENTDTLSDLNNKALPEEKNADVPEKKRDDKNIFSNFLNKTDRTIMGLIIVVILLFLLLIMIIIKLKFFQKSESVPLNTPSVDKVKTEKPPKTATPFAELSENTMKAANESVTKVDAVTGMMISTIPKRYEKIWKISKGGMGVVFGAHDTFLQRRVAIKMISPSLCDDKTIINRFVNEARSVAALDHPNILKIFDVGGDQFPFFVMEYLEGISLEDMIIKKQKMNNAEIKYYGLQMADAFKYCHERGIIHRDIKPANVIIVNNFKLVKVVDFGIAKDPSQQGLTSSNVSIGSPQYMAPEQMKDNQYGIPSDIYSFGITMYKMATGTFPFDSNNLMSRFTQQPVLLNKYAPDTDKLLASLIMKCINFKPEDRFRDFNQIRTILFKIKI